MSTTQTIESGSGAAFEAPYFDRVRERTSPRVNRRIDLSTARSVERFLDADPAAIARHIDDLDREWDIDRAVMAVFAGAGGVAWLLSLRRWMAGQRPGRAAAALAVQLGFLFYHSRAGWCPPVAVLRRLGFRTRMEIEEEKRALMALRARPGLTESVLVIASD